MFCYFIRFTETIDMTGADERSRTAGLLITNQFFDFSHNPILNHYSLDIEGFQEYLIYESFI